MSSRAAGGARRARRFVLLRDLAGAATGFLLDGSRRRTIDPEAPAPPTGCVQATALAPAAGLFVRSLGARKEKSNFFDFFRFFIIFFLCFFLRNVSSARNECDVTFLQFLKKIKIKKNKLNKKRNFFPVKSEGSSTKETRFDSLRSWLCGISNSSAGCSRDRRPPRRLPLGQKPRPPVQCPTGLYGAPACFRRNILAMAMLLKRNNTRPGRSLKTGRYSKRRARVAASFARVKSTAEYEILPPCLRTGIAPALGETVPGELNSWR